VTAEDFLRTRTRHRRISDGAARRNTPRSDRRGLNSFWLAAADRLPRSRTVCAPGFGAPLRLRGQSGYAPDGSGGPKGAGSENLNATASDANGISCGRLRGRVRGDRGPHEASGKGAQSTGHPRRLPAANRNPGACKAPAESPSRQTGVVSAGDLSSCPYSQSAWNRNSRKLAYEILHSLAPIRAEKWAFFAPDGTGAYLTPREAYPLQERSAARAGDGPYTPNFAF
jgi:hypothetical protein